ncbi:MAG: hypothetical protein ACO1N3_01655 [Gammaproteobacteria bacterium]
MKKNTLGILSLYLVSLNISQICYALEDNDPLAEYCVSKSGTLTPMTAWFETQNGPVAGLTEKFCTFERDNGYIVIGLSAFASEHANIAATYMKSLTEIKMGSDVMQDKDKSATNTKSAGLGLANPSYAVCKNLGGTAINYKFHGNFRPKAGGDSDICVFGDGSMVSAWSLIYMANHRAGYDEVKGYVRSEPLPLP